MSEAISGIVNRSPDVASLIRATKLDVERNLRRRHLDAAEAVETEDEAVARRDR
jgi:hypothetical protein